MDKHDEKIFYEIYNGLPRKGPGSFESTKKAYEIIKDKLNRPKILDVGCGNGKQTLDLLKISDGFITALDNHKPYIEELNEKIHAEKFSDRVVAEVGDMFSINYPENSFDLIWSEGAIYIMGLIPGLLEFKKFLAPGGFIAVSEISWLTNQHSYEARSYWYNAYPHMGSIRTNIEIINNCGYKLIDHFVMPESAWWDEFYKYLEVSLNKLKVKYKNDEKAIGILTAEEYEIELFRKYSCEYGYVFYVMQLRD
ncbi:MAG: methyltransferase domain-containing protein [Melioribacteraceae bacterium]|nr:methyltransferase domain-containing protein [Melioribacteraceae bacterium]